MKKLAKGCIIAAVVFILLGIIVLAAAAGIGGINEIGRMARRGELGIVAYNEGFDEYGDIDYEDDDYEDTDYAGSGDEENDWDESYGLEKSGDVKEISMEGHLAADEISRLKIDFSAGVLYIRTTDSENFRVETNREELLDCYTDGDRLVLRDKGNLNAAFFRDKINDRELYLYIPKDADLERLEIDLGAGKADVGPLAVREMDVSVGAGKAGLRGVEAQDAAFEVGAGKLTVDNAVIENAEVSVSVGKAAFSGAITQELDAECSMGDLEIWLDGEEEDYNYQVDADMGKVTFNGKDRRSWSERKIDNGADSDIKLDVSMGTVNVYFEEYR